RSRVRPGRWPTSVWTRARSASPPRGPRSRASRPARRVRRARSSPTRAAPALPRWPTSSRRRSSSEAERQRNSRDMSEVLVLIDHVDGAVKKPTYELLTIAKRLGEPSAVFIGAADQAAGAAEAVAKYGAEKVYTVDSAEL